MQFDDEHDRDHWYSAFAPHPLPDLTTKKGGSGGGECFFWPKIMFDGVYRRHSHPENCPKWHTPTRSPDAPTARFRSRH